MSNLNEILGEELFKQVSEKLGDKKLIVNDGNYIPKAKFDEVIGSKNELKTQVSELSTQLESLKKTAKGNEELTKAIEELQKKNTDWEGKYKNTLLESSVKIKAMAEKAKDASDLMKFLDLSKLEIDESGNAKGLEEQIKALKESKPYLFELNTQNNTTPPNPSGVDNKTEIQQLEEAYEAAKKAGNMAMMISLHNKIFNLNKK